LLWLYKDVALEGVPWGQPPPEKTGTTAIIEGYHSDGDSRRVIDTKMQAGLLQVGVFLSGWVLQHILLTLKAADKARELQHEHNQGLALCKSMPKLSPLPPVQDLSLGPAQLVIRNVNLINL
jgi:hypothetical protein